ncbi:hypothetical protein H8356DRAFT_1686716 [Neocallimastix lanati (nom. inval.)]|jgi:uncharacterized protein YxjI|uniref:Tubby C-terminal domain-containing protein n=1 Tax=Neocallimastix californiae TaxID=1754190 RepID=A0A1Y2FR64_9FUNG|nr:hypothetical protein H8356DRAFT_1686716 [Neocallimastix sp. JGI-2020a]ORY85205.1 hypothetical protein LY90DRAFT_697053 [Neocallimastix californiae]|eukprot:ORY85205.1 hypothetical protein LY90DRAFT_697053 [Neocallimastix californiae]
MLSTKGRICVVDEKFVSEKPTKFQIENLNKFFKINNNILDSCGKVLYHCEKNKFYDRDNNVLFEYELKKGLSTSKLNIIINSKASSTTVIIKNRFAFNFELIFYNEALKKETTLKLKGHVFKNSYEIMNEDSSSLLCSFKRNGLLNPSYSVEMTKGLDTVFMLILIIATTNIIQRNQAIAASS